MAHPKLTPALQASIVNAVSLGVPYLKAAVLAGLSPAAAYEYRQRGEGRHPHRPASRVYVEFVEAIKRAEAQDQARRVARIEQAARGGQITHEKTTTYPDGRVVREVKTLPPQWVADAWHLERSDPKRWGRRDRVDVHTYREKVAKKAQELSEQYDLDAAELIERAERYANGLEEDDDGA
jgi:hypothetical protein